MKDMEDLAVALDIVPAFSDDALALKFADCHESHLRYVSKGGGWMIFDGKRWKREDTLQAFDLSRKVCRDAAAECNDNSGKALASSKTVAAVERLAQADRRLAATVDQWDCDPWLLNTPGGIVDLKTGRKRKALAGDYMTKMTAIDPGGDCPMWRSFLRYVTKENVELQDFLQRICGYALTGVTNEHALFFFYGTGKNGKSVFLNTINRIMADYQKTAAIETFTASTTSQHPTDLAGLMGARLVTAIETEEGRRWAESRIKSLTGGDKISARFMRQDFFEFTPQFKLMIAGNHKPGLRAVDEAMRRRFNLIPFTVFIPKEKQDKKLEEKLEAEWPGILQWMIEGCMAWQAQGLNAPEVVISATAEYLEAEDAISAWLDECTDQIKGTYASVGDLFTSWAKWAKEAGELPGSKKAFSQNLSTRGFQKGAGRDRRTFLDIKLKMVGPGNDF